MEYFLANIHCPVVLPVPGILDHLLIGRGEDCDLRLTSPSVSRQHAEMWFLGESLFLRDLGSRNGTAVNGIPIRHAAMELQCGDVVTFAMESFVVRAAAVAERTSVPAETLHAR